MEFRDLIDGDALLDALNAEVVERCNIMAQQLSEEAGEKQLWDDYYRGHQQEPRVPASVDQSVKDLAPKSIVNMIQLAVNIPTQMSVCEGYSRMGSEDEDVIFEPPEWKVWKDSGFRSTQTPLFRSSGKFGFGYTSLENCWIGAEGDPKIKLLATRDTIAYFEDPVNDRIPMFAMTIRQTPTVNQPGIAVYYDADNIVFLDYEQPDEFKNPRYFPHALGVCPVVRFPCEMDDEGRGLGIVEPLIAPQNRINQTTFDLLVTQTFSSFKVRYAAGLAGDPILDKEGQPVRDENGFIQYEPLTVDQSRILLTDNDSAKFGTLDETPLDGFISAWENAVRAMAVLGNIPPHALLGNMANLAGETIEAALGQTNRFVNMLRQSWAESIRQLMHIVRLSMNIDPGEEWDDEVRWRDVSELSLAQVADGLGKLSQMLGVPGEALWPRIPRITQGELRKMRALNKQQQEAQRDDPSNPVIAAEREDEPETLGVFADSSSGVLNGRTS